MKPFRKMALVQGGGQRSMTSGELRHITREYTLKFIFLLFKFKHNLLQGDERVILCKGYNYDLSYLGR
jgi:hypothetical protein